MCVNFSSLYELTSSLSKQHRYFTKIIGVQKPFPTISEWVWGGLSSVPTYFISIGIEEFKKPYASAEGYTGSYELANLSRKMVEFALTGLAQFHSAYWYAFLVCFFSLIILEHVITNITTTTTTGT